jgi:hypothetical protein
MNVDNGVPVSEVRAATAEAYDASYRPLWPDEVPAPIDDMQRQVEENVVLGYD